MGHPALRRDLLRLGLIGAVLLSVGSVAHAEPTEGLSLRIESWCLPQYGGACVPPEHPCAGIAPPGRPLAVKLEATEDGSPASGQRIEWSSTNQSGRGWTGPDGRLTIALQPGEDVAVRATGRDAVLPVEPAWGGISLSVPEETLAGDAGHPSSFLFDSMFTGVGAPSSIEGRFLVTAETLEGGSLGSLDAPFVDGKANMTLSHPVDGVVRYVIEDVDACGLPLAEQRVFLVDWVVAEVRLPELDGWLTPAPFTLDITGDGDLWWRIGEDAWQRPPVQVPQGVHRVEAKSIGPGGVESAVVNRTYRVDGAPPGSVDGVRADVLRGDVTLSWNATEDSGGAGIAAYQVLRGQEDALVAEVGPEMRGFVDAGRTAGPETYRVRAVDAAGNLGDPSEALTVVVDRTAPSIRLTSHANGSAMASGSLLHLLVSDASPVSGTVWLDGRALSGAGPAWTVETSGLAQGAHSIRVEATDAQGNVAHALFGFILDDRLPRIQEVEAIAPEGQTAFRPGDRVRLHADVRSPRAEIDEVRMHTSWNTSHEMVFDGDGYRAEGIVPTSGAAWVQVEARNAYGLVAESDQIPLVIDRTPPVVRGDGPMHVRPGGTLPLHLEDDTGIAALTVVLDGIAADVADDRTVRLPSVPEGERTLRVVALDMAGRQTEFEALVTVDATPPALAVAWKDLVAPGTELRATARDDHAVSLEMRASAGPWTPIGSTFALPRTEGVHLVEVRASDPAGNVATVRHTVTVDARPPMIRFSVPNMTPIMKGEVGWRIEDVSEVTVEVHVDGIERIDLAAQGALLADDVSGGRHILIVTARDALGQEARGQLAFYRMTQASIDNGLFDLRMPRDVPTEMTPRLLLTDAQGASYAIDLVLGSDGRYVVLAPTGTPQETTVRLVMEDKVSGSQITMYEGPLSRVSDGIASTSEESEDDGSGGANRPVGVYLLSGAFLFLSGVGAGFYLRRR